MDNELFVYTTPEDILRTLSRLLKKRRLEKGYSRASLQAVTGVPAPTIAKFETTSEISLKSFVRLAMALGYEEELAGLLTEDKYTTMEEMETIKKNRNRIRGTRKC
ncbi:MAG: helix-turn-helix domain-containing protein [Candidatus Cryptobacteroides sp.]